MKRLLEFAPECLLCHVGYLASLPEWFTAARASLQLGDILAFDVARADDALTRLRPLAIDDMPRVMDHFYLWTPRSIPACRQDLLDALFELTAVDFEHIIRPEQNRDNIRCLLNIISRHFQGQRVARILDFGCGTGLSAQVASELGIHLHGYDRCPKMRSLAAEQGLQLMVPEQFNNVCLPVFNAVFCSYVFHLLPTKDDLCQLWTILKPGGIVVGNFHKDHGLHEASTCFMKCGARAHEVEDVSCRFQHGSYWMFVRHE
ncbi:MAG TPA: hypothetical protein DCZ95_08545 [Verrucomicrobia bacterium]|nr:hypothetical protein [Verrucomicrobiota bacterium]